MRGIRTLAVGLIGLSLSPSSSEASTSVIAPSFSLQGGPDTDSMSGASTFGLLVGTESSPGALRFSLGVEGHYSSGVVEYGSTAYAADRIGAQLRCGMAIHAFSTAKIRLIFGVHGIVGVEMFRSPSAPSGVSNSALASGLGYELEAGFAFPTGGDSDLRLLGGYEKFKTKLATRDINLDRITARLALGF